ncbi:hypothetical protein GEMRC1_010775 [Eukaryota sp. GEM-RC1]
MDDNYLYICSEYCPYGSFWDLIRSAGPLNESQARYVLRGVVTALAVLHERRICHRDIKAANILLSNDFSPRLADFGVATQLQSTLSKRNTIIGSPFWMDPQVIKGLPYVESCDIWSLGITAIELVEGKPPLSDEFKHPMGALLAIPNRDPPTLANPSKWSREFNDFLNYCLQKKSEKRYTAKQLLKSPFLQTPDEHPTSELMLQFVDAAKLGKEYDSTFEISSTAATSVYSTVINDRSFDPDSYGTAQWNGFNSGDDTLSFETVRLSTQPTRSNLDRSTTPTFVKQIRLDREDQERKEKYKERMDDIKGMSFDCLKRHLELLKKEKEHLKVELDSVEKLMSVCKERLEEGDANCFETIVFQPQGVIDS